ncbi:hypothetical protein F7Q90_08480 [Pantoea stewartii subsp. stewartii]|nr:hypothetical protein F7Q90_08480 [Pantoea stewartii subsp. stewartii]
MRITPFVHDACDASTADELLSRYKLRNIQATKSLAFDPRLWIVTAMLPTYRERPIPTRQYKNPMWSRL